MGVTRRGGRDAEAAAGDACIVAQSALLEVGQRGVGEDQLAGGETARMSGRNPGRGAKERDLEAPEPRLGLEGAGDVPPFGPGLGMSAEVGGETQRWRAGLRSGEARHTERAR